MNHLNHNQLLYNQIEDGITHINVYSKGNTILGQLLSNFAHTPFTSINNLRYESVEGWWYFYITGKQYHYLRDLYGVKAKLEGKRYPRVLEVSKDLLKQVYLLKLEQNPDLKKRFLENTLPYTHYYVYGGRVIVKSSWTGELWNEIYNEFNFK